MKGGISMSLNPFFSEKKIPERKPVVINSPVNPAQSKKSIKPRKTRSDKTHNLKFPVTPVEHMELRTTCKQVSNLYKQLKNDDLTQTKFNTYLLNYALKNLAIVNWNRPYQDSKKYMHVTPLETIYQDIGGPHGLAIQKGISERKVTFYLVLSALKFIKGDGDYAKIF